MSRIKKQRITIVLPAELADLHVKVLRGRHNAEIICSAEEAEQITSTKEDPLRDYIFVWTRNQYRKITRDEILWIEADRSYCCIHTDNKEQLTVSFPMGLVGQLLVSPDFVRIHRSFIVNLKHVDYLAGNSLRLGSVSLMIGREYRQALLDRFIFIGVRNKRKTGFSEKVPATEDAI